MERVICSTRAIMRVRGSTALYAVKRANNMLGIIQMKGFSRRAKKAPKTPINGITLAVEQNNPPTGEITVYHEKPQFLGWIRTLRQLYNSGRLPKHLKNHEFYDLGYKLELPIAALQLTKYRQEVIEALITKTIAIAPRLFYGLRLVEPWLLDMPTERQQLLPKAFRQMSREEGNLWTSESKLRINTKVSPLPAITRLNTTPTHGLPDWVRWGLRTEG
jgi:hypothetical protein